jgi:hypothetical protein
VAVHAIDRKTPNYQFYLLATFPNLELGYEQLRLDVNAYVPSFVDAPGNLAKQSQCDANVLASSHKIKGPHENFKAPVPSCIELRAWLPLVASSATLYCPGTVQVLILTH